jgi:hypothetical protein
MEIVDRYDDACVPAGATDYLAIFLLAWNMTSGEVLVDL